LKLIDGDRTRGDDVIGALVDAHRRREPAAGAAAVGLAAFQLLDPREVDLDQGVWGRRTASLRKPPGPLTLTFASVSPALATMAAKSKVSHTLFPTTVGKKSHPT